MLNLNHVYNYYNTQIAPPRGPARPQANKRNDLKTVYNNMVKQNQNSPFYKFTFSDANQAYAIGIKEAALSLEMESKLLSGQGDDPKEHLKAVSDNENVVFANLNDTSSTDLPDNIAIKVDTLAKGQTNVGSYLPSGESSFPTGEYSFGIAVGRNQYTFRLKVNEGDTNQQIQRNLAASINENNIGVKASIRNNRMEGSSALVLRSEAIGKPNNSDLYFQFDEAYLEDDITSVLGVDQVETAPSNAEFYINDTLHTSISNRISLNHSVDIDLLAVSDKPVHVRLVPDETKVADQLKDFLNSYNQLVDIARSGNQKGSTKLFRDVTGMANRHRAAIESAGLTINKDGYLAQGDEIVPDKVQELFDEDSSFRKDIKRTTDKMTLNPLHYIDKVVVTYPNTSGTYPNPYYPSKYSGLLFNDYS